MEQVSWGHGDGANKPGMKSGTSKAGRKENGTCGFRNSVLSGSRPSSCCPGDCCGSELGCGEAVMVTPPAPACGARGGLS